MAANCVVVLLRSGSVLLARRGDGAWEFPWGALLDGETPESAAARILNAEFGILPGPAKELARAGDRVGILVSGFAGALKPVGDEEVAWVESRRVLERELSPVCRPIAEVVALHRRRSRYSGTHPRSFDEKYKELSGDPDAMAKAAARGSTPAGAHLSIMVPEISAALAPLAGATALDCTLGWGGHAAALARAGAKVIGLDRDGEELARTQARLAAAELDVTARQSDYAGARGVLKSLDIVAVDALLADLGVSSMQLDRPERGMSFKNDGPLDMRMDRSRGATAAEWIESATRAQIVDALVRYGDEPDAEKIAAELRARVDRRRAPKTTAELVDAVAAAKGLTPDQMRKKDAFAKHPAARVFQALRIVVNSERESLLALLEDLPRLLRSGGRVALLTFHSGEEKLVQAALDAQANAGLWRAPLPAPRKASAEEVRLNPRARSARLWTAVRA